MYTLSDTNLALYYFELIQEDSAYYLEAQKHHGSILNLNIRFFSKHIALIERSKIKANLANS